jgi:hypothetical protein
MNRVFSVASFASLALAHTTLAGPPPEPHFDIWLRPVNGQIVTGSITEGTPGDPIEDVFRVFGAELGEDPSFPFSATEPGLQALAGPETAGMVWTFDILDSLTLWNGGGFSATDETMLIEFGPASASTAGGAGPGFGFTGFADGLLHDHFDFTLDGAAPVIGSDPDPGIYLLALSMRGQNGQTQYESSLPFYIVFNLGQSEEDHDAAIDWVQANLVPSPSAIPLLLAGLMVASRRRRS